MEEFTKTKVKLPWRGILLALVVSGLALLFVFSKISNPKEIIRELQAFPKGYFFLAVFFILLAWVVDGQRIGTLTRAINEQIPWWELTLILGAANFLTLVTPFAGGGGALVVYYLYRRGVPTAKATAVVVAGGMAGQLSLATLLLFTFTSLKGLPSDLANYLIYLKIASLAYILILIGLIILITKSNNFFSWLFRKREGRSANWIGEFRRSYQYFFQGGKKYYALCFLIATIYYLVYYSAGFVLLSGFNVFTPLVRYATSVFFGIAPVFSPIPGGAGISEGFAYLVLRSLPSEALGTFIVLWRTVVFYIPILLGSLIFASLTLNWAASKEEGEEELENF